MANSIYSPITLEVGNILKDVLTGKIGLPDLQRPFVWKNDKVRDLLDSMLRGYPIGYVMLWESPSDDTSKKAQIGENEKAYAAPKELVIDGQQRLTALLAAFYGVEVRDKAFNSRAIRIAYNPITGEFKVADASTDRDPRFVSCVSDVFRANRENGLSGYRRAFIRALNESNRKKGEPELDDPAEDAIERGLAALLGLERYYLPVLSITDDADEETVSDIFVRVNSQGQALKQDDFIMTLLSVYEPAMRERIERFCADSHVPKGGTSYNQLATVSPTSIIRTAVAVGFKRGRLRYAYQILRGKDLKTKETSAQTRDDNFECFGAALDQVLDLNNWHAFINLLGEAGYVAPSQISSANALFFTYAFYLIGKREFGLKHTDLSRLVRRWFFACSITSYYVGGFETAFERQLTDISQMTVASDFSEYFERSVASLLTDDHFGITLPNDLDANVPSAPPGTASSRLRSSSAASRCSARPRSPSFCCRARRARRRRSTSTTYSRTITSSPSDRKRSAAPVRTSLSWTTAPTSRSQMTPRSTTCRGSSRSSDTRPTSEPARSTPSLSSSRGLTTNASSTGGASSWQS